MTISPSPAARMDAHAHLHSYTNLATHEEVGPLMITRGDGVYVEDESGKRYLEGMSGLWCSSLGFSHPRLVQAGVDALRQLPYYHTFNHRSNSAVAELSERLLALAPVPMARVFFANSGSEANDSALKMVWYYHNSIGKPLKKKVIARTRAYHGVTIASASLGGLQANHDGFDLPIDRILRVGCPHFYRNGQPGDSEQDFATRLADEIEQLILAEGPETVAAFIAEPVMGAGGVIVPPQTYFEKVQAVLRRHDVLMIADEVICGLGRTGQMFGSTTFDIQPDILTCAKALTSGYVPMSAVMVSPKVFEGLAAGSSKHGVFGHGFTYSGHPVAAAVALETLKVYEDEDIMGKAQRLAPVFQIGMQAFADHPLVGEVRGVGMIGAIELVADKASHKPFDPALKLGAKWAAQAQQRGLIVRAMGDAVALCPPLISSQKEITAMLEILETALGDVQGSLCESISSRAP